MKRIGDYCMSTTAHRSEMKKEFLKERVRHIDVLKTRTVGELVEAMRYTSFQSRNVGTALEVYRSILNDPARPTVFLGLAGAMVPGGMRKIISDMIRYKLVDVVVSTGANLYHDFCEALGIPPFMGTPHVDDVKLRDLRIDRVFDTFIDEDECIKVDDLIASVAEELEAKHYSTRELLARLGSHTEDENCILHVASKFGAPVYAPAISDSSIGISLTKYYANRRLKDREMARVDPIRDNYEMAQIKSLSKKTGAVFIGGGTPKNYTQQVSVILDVLGLPSRGHDYGIQITTDDPKWGGLSGCTFKESTSWGKISGDAALSIVYMDATVGLPLIVAAVMQQCSDLIEKRTRLRFVWEEDTLKEILHEKD